MTSVVIRSERLSRFQRLNGTLQCQTSGQIQELFAAPFALLDQGMGVNMAMSTPGSPAVIGLTRLYCNQGEIFLLIDVASEEASRRAEELVNDGWEIEAEIPI